MRENLKPPEELLNLANFLFESNEDLTMALIGGLPIQEIIADRRVRRTSDIDIMFDSRESATKFIERGKKNLNYDTFYNEKLDKYSVFNHEEGIHIDVYPGKLGEYKPDNNFWENKIQPEGYSLIMASPEDLIAIKLYSYLFSTQGKNKHLVDIYSIILGKYEIRVGYLIDRLGYLSKLLNIPTENLVSTLTDIKENTLAQFTSKEKRFLKEEMEYLKRELLKEVYQT